jgi:hypothetical protein
LTDGGWPCYHTRIVWWKTYCGALQDLYYIIAYIPRTTVDHKPIYFADYKIGGGKLEGILRASTLCIHQVVGTPAAGRRECRAIVINSRLKALLAAWVAVGRCNFQRNGRSAGKEAKPFVVVQLPARAAREVPWLITVVNFGTVIIQVFTNDRVATVAARVWETGRRAVLAIK